MASGGRVEIDGYGFLLAVTVDLQTASHVFWKRANQPPCGLRAGG